MFLFQTLKGASGKSYLDHVSEHTGVVLKGDKSHHAEYWVTLCLVRHELCFRGKCYFKATPPPRCVGVFARFSRRLFSAHFLRSARFCLSTKLFLAVASLSPRTFIPRSIEITATRNSSWSAIGISWLAPAPRHCTIFLVNRLARDKSKYLYNYTFPLFYELWITLNSLKKYFRFLIFLDLLVMSNCQLRATTLLR